MIKLFVKDFKLFFKDNRSVLLTFLLPIILITLFALAFGALGGENNPAPAELLIVDSDQSSLSKKAIMGLDSIAGLKGIPSDISESRKLITKGKYAGALIFHPGFEDSVRAGKHMPVELLYDEAREMEIGMLQPVLSSSLMSSAGKYILSAQIDSYLKRNFPGLENDLRDKILRDALPDDKRKADFSMHPSIKTTPIVSEKNKSNLGLIQAVAGNAIMMLLFSVAALGTSVIEEKETGTIKRLLYSPLNSSDILYGKLMFSIFISILQLTIMFLFAFVAFGLDIFINLPALICMITATAFAVSGFGLFLAAVSKTRQQAQSLSTLIILIMSVIGGSMIPLFIMPEVMRKIAVFSVNYWGIQGFFDILWRRLPLFDILPRILVLISIGLFMSFFSVRLFKSNVFKMV